MRLLWFNSLGLLLLLTGSLFTSIVPASVTNTINLQTEFSLPQFTQSGRYFNFPSGIARSSKGYFYVTDSLSNRIKVLSAQGELIRSWGSFGTGPGQFDRPIGIALTPSGELLVADTNNNRIQKFNNEGQWLAQIGEFGSAKSQFNHPNQLTVDKNGRIYVSDTLNHRVQVFSADGQWLSSFGGFGDLDGQLKHPLGIAVSDDEIFVAEGEDNHRISVFNLAGVFIRKWGQIGSENGKLNNPEHIVLDAQQNVYVSEYSNNRIQVFDRKGKWLKSWGKLGFSGADLRTPFGLALDQDRNLIYVADTSNNRIQHYDLQGNYQGAWQSQGSDTGEFSSPKLSLSPDGDIYVADQQNHRIQVFSASGVWLRSFGSFGTAPGQFSAPNHVTFTLDGNIVVADTGNDRIQILNKQGKSLKVWGTSGGSKGQLDGPGNFTIGSDGLLYITELVNNRISVFTLEGKFVRAWGKFGSGKVELNRPDGIVIDSDGLVYVSDHDNFRIQVFDLQGNYVREWGKEGSEPGYFRHPHGVALSPSGLLYVCDALNNRIQVFKRDGTLVEIIGEVGTQPGQFSQPYTIAMSDENTLYVSEVANNRIQLVKRHTAITTRTQVKAILVAGGGASTDTFDNPIWDATELLSNNAYYALRAQDLGKDDILYLTSGNTENDLDEDGRYDDLHTATLASLEQAMLNWAANTDNLIVYLIGHGGEGRFKINQREILTSKQLKIWLDGLDKTITGKVTVILEACQSGSFLEDLAKPNRYLITSATRDQPAVVSNQGVTSFSYPFWYAIHLGSDLSSSFKKARQAISRENVLVENKPQEQNAQLDSNGDGQSDEQDYSSLGKFCLTRCKKAASDEPQVQPLTTNTNLNGRQDYNLSMIVSSLAPLSQAWVIVSRPDVNYSDPSQPITDLPTLDLACVDQGSGQYYCQGDYKQFTANGDYYLTFHARDQKNRSSVSEASIKLTQSPNSGNGIDNIYYDTQTGILSIQDLLIDGQHYLVNLKQQAGKIIVSLVTNTKKFFASPITYNPVSGILTLNKIRVDNHYYQAKLKVSGNFVFSLIQLKDLGVVKPIKPTPTPTPTPTDIGVDDAQPNIL